MRSFVAFAAVLLLAVASGCGMCQDCFDYTGPVLESPNHPHDGVRSGSALSGVPAEMEGVVVEGMPVEAAPVE